MVGGTYPRTAFASLGKIFFLENPFLMDDKTSFIKGCEGIPIHSSTTVVEV